MKKVLLAIYAISILAMVGCENITQTSEESSNQNSRSSSSEIVDVSHQPEKSEQSKLTRKSNGKIKAVKSVAEQEIIAEEIVEESLDQQEHSLISAHSEISADVSENSEPEITYFSVCDSTEECSEESEEISTETSVDESYEDESSEYELSEEFAETTSSKSEDKPEISSEESSKIEESIEDKEETWGITKRECTTDDGYDIGAFVYVKIVEDNPDNEYCTIQWYDSTTRLDKSCIETFSVLTSQIPNFISERKTVGVITS